jgi:GGDEF domain-containing protein
LPDAAPEATDRLNSRIEKSIRLSDIDHFKKINDTCGHQSGDAVLRGFSQCIQTVIRKQVDWAGRYGGESFLVVLPETGQTGAMILVERLRTAVSVVLPGPAGATCLLPPASAGRPPVLRGQSGGAQPGEGVSVDELSRTARPVCHSQYPFLSATVFTHPANGVQTRVPDGFRKRSRCWRIIGAEPD